MNDYMLRTSSEQEMMSAISLAGLVNNGRVVDGVTLDIIGTIPPVFDVEGNEIKPADGRFHANARIVFTLSHEQIKDLPTFAPLPVTPYRVFA